MNRKTTLNARWHAHECPCGTAWECSKPDCRDTDDCTACELQRMDDHFRARGDSAEQLEIPRVQ